MYCALHCLVLIKQRTDILSASIIIVFYWLVFKVIELYIFDDEDKFQDEIYMHVTR
jgi:hypothetical protein